MGRTDVTDDKITEIFEKYDTNKDDKIDFMEYLEMCVQLSETRKEFGK